MTSRLLVALMMVGWSGSRGLGLGLAAADAAKPAPVADAATYVTAGVGPCRAGGLRATVSLQGATGSLAGSIEFTNRSGQACTLSGHPQVQLRDRSGRVLPVAEVFMRSGLLGSAPVATVQLEPSQDAAIFVVWSEWCHGAIAGPITMTVQLPGNAGTGAARVRNIVFNGRTITPRCDVSSARSTISVDRFEPFEPVGAPPSFVIRDYYHEINSHAFENAYRYLAPTGRPAFNAFVRGYQTTNLVYLSRMATTGYRIRRSGARYTCIGIQLMARQNNGSVLEFGGWYTLDTSDPNNPLISIPGSRIAANAPLRVPSRQECAEGIPG